MRWPRSARVLAVTAVAAAAAAPVGWLVTDHLERDNDFCTACHLEAEVPLHAALRRDFELPEPVSLASAHRRAGVADRADAAFRCIDCHGGVSPLGRLRVKVLAAKDAFWYLVGRFEEPTGMRWPLWDEDCTRCHARFDEAAPEPWQNPRFHQLSVHNAELGVDCVECHRVHETDGAADAYFLHAAWTRSQCVRCHPEFQEGEG